MESFWLNLSFKSEDSDILRLDWSEKDDTELMAIINCDVLPLHSKTKKIKLSSSSPPDNIPNIPAAMKDRLSTNPDKSKKETVKETKPSRSYPDIRNTLKECVCEDADILQLDWSEKDDAELMATINCDVPPLPSTTNRIELSSLPPDNKANKPSTNSVKSKAETVKESKSYRSRSPYRHARDESEYRYKCKRSLDNHDAKERSRRHNSRNSREYCTRKRTRDYSRSHDRSYTNKKRKVN